VRSRVTGAEAAARPVADGVNIAAEAAPGWAAPLPDDDDPGSIVPPAAGPEFGTTPTGLVPPSGTAAVDALGSTVPGAVDEVVTFGSVVVTFGSEVVTGSVGTVVVTFGTVVVTFGIVVVIFGIVVVTGSVVVTFGSVVVTGSVVEIVGSAVVIVSCGRAECPRMGALAKKPRRRRAARAAARLTHQAYPIRPLAILTDHVSEASVSVAKRIQAGPALDNRLLGICKRSDNRLGDQYRLISISRSSLIPKWCAISWRTTRRTSL
jgi:hypothetical protein